MMIMVNTNKPNVTMLLLMLAEVSLQLIFVDSEDDDLQLVNY